MARRRFALARRYGRARGARGTIGPAALAYGAVSSAVGAAVGASVGGPTGAYWGAAVGGALAAGAIDIVATRHLTRGETFVEKLTELAPKTLAAPVETIAELTGK